LVKSRCIPWASLMLESKWFPHMPVCVQYSTRWLLGARDR